MSLFELIYVYAMFIFGHYTYYLQNWLSAAPVPPSSADNRESGNLLH